MFCLCHETVKPTYKADKAKGGLRVSPIFFFVLTILGKCKKNYYYIKYFTEKISVFVSKKMYVQKKEKKKKT